MRRYKLKDGYILTLENEELIEPDGTVPFSSYFSDTDLHRFTQIYTDLHGFDFDQILSITNLMESYDIDHNNLKSV